MFVFGHVGVGRAIVGPIGRVLPLLPFVTGALLPDLVDKPLYFAHVSSVISCTRTFGHTGLFLGMLALVALATRSRVWAAVALGVSTHVALDVFMDLFSNEPSSAFIALTWPFRQTHFASYVFSSPSDQLAQIWKPQIMLGEAAGLAFLAWEYRRYRRRQRSRETA